MSKSDSIKASGAKAGGAKGPRRTSVNSPGSGALRMLNIGYGNLVLAARVIAVISPSGSPMRRLRDEAVERGKLVDATQGRKTRSILVTDSDHIILSAMTPETISARLAPDDPEAAA